MVWAMRTVFMMISDSSWKPGGLVDPPQPFDAYRHNRLSLTSPFVIVRGPSHRRSA